MKKFLAEKKPYRKHEQALLALAKQETTTRLFRSGFPEALVFCLDVLNDRHEFELAPAIDFRLKALKVERLSFLAQEAPVTKLCADGRVVSFLNTHSKLAFTENAKKIFALHIETNRSVFALLVTKLKENETKPCLQFLTDIYLLLAEKEPTRINDSLLDFFGVQLQFGKKGGRENFAGIRNTETFVAVVKLVLANKENTAVCDLVFEECLLKIGQFAKRTLTAAEVSIILEFIFSQHLIKEKANRLLVFVESLVEMCVENLDLVEVLPTATFLATHSASKPGLQGLVQNLKINFMNLTKCNSLYEDFFAAYFSSFGNLTDADDEFVWLLKLVRSKDTVAGTSALNIVLLLQKKLGKSFLVSFGEVLKIRLEQVRTKTMERAWKQKLTEVLEKLVQGAK